MQKSTKILNQNRGLPGSCYLGCTLFGLLRRCCQYVYQLSKTRQGRPGKIRERNVMHHLAMQ